MNSFRDLDVWRFSIDLSVEIYRATSTFPSEEKFGLVSQMRRAAVSIPSNIAEGSGRGAKRDFRHFVLIAKGSANELQSHFLIAEWLGYLEQSTARNLDESCRTVGRMLHGLADFLRSRGESERAGGRQETRS